MKDYEQIKRDVNLTEVAAHFHYEIIRKESSRNCIMMKYGHHKIAVTRDEDGHYIYYTIGNPAKIDSGSAIDFVMNRLHCDFQGAVTWFKQEWQHIPDSERPRRNTYASKIESSSKDTQSVIKNLIKMPLMSESAYLASRGIMKDTLTSPRFHGRIYKDTRNNVIFPHYSNGICGYELKNNGFTGFSPNGQKALWFSNAEKTDHTLVIAESAIDAISYSILYPDSSDRTRYASIGGAMSPKAKDVLHKAVKDFPGQQITLAFDKDDGGEKITQDVQSLLADTGKQITVHLPQNKDFNDDLKQKLGLPDKPTHTTRTRNDTKRER
jgi:Toprim-like/Protein of unknown function (DUF3991)